MTKRSVPLSGKWLIDFRETAGLTLPCQPLSVARSRLVELIDEFLYSLSCGWEIPPECPTDRFVPSVYGKRDLLASIVQYLIEFGFSGDARRLHDAAVRFYDHRDWNLMTPNPRDDIGWKEFQARYVNPMVHLAGQLRGVICELRQLVIETDSEATPSKGQGSPKSITHDEAETTARRLSKKDVTFQHLTAEEMANRIQQESRKQCSPTLVKGLPYWKEAMKVTGRGRRQDGKGKGSAHGTAARPISLTSDLEAVTGDGREHEILEELVDAEEAAAAQQASRYLSQAILHINNSSLKNKEKLETIKRLKEGDMTPQQAVEMVSMLKQNPNRPKPLKHD